LGYKGSRPQGIRVQRRSSVGVIRYYARQKGRALEHEGTGKAVRDKTFNATGVGVRHRQESSIVSPSRPDTTTVAKI